MSDSNEINIQSLFDHAYDLIDTKVGEKMRLGRDLIQLLGRHTSAGKPMLIPGGSITVLEDGVLSIKVEDWGERYVSRHDAQVFANDILARKGVAPMLPNKAGWSEATQWWPKRHFFRLEQSDSCLCEVRKAPDGKYLAPAHTVTEDDCPKCSELLEQAVTTRGED